MLKEIICDKIPSGKLTFNAGLNVIVGDETASNSIGKSSALLMIDFALGGDYYARRDDIIKNIGHHEVRMHFTFEGRDFFFSRNTATFNNVYKCNSNYEIQGTLRSNDYKQYLSSLYRTDHLALKFGEIVSQFCRVYGKDNYNEREPLFPGYSQSAQDRVVFLVKLFNNFEDIEEQQRVVKEANEKKQSYGKVVRLKLVAPVKNKTEYKKILTNIDKLEGEADLLKTQIASQTLSLTSEQLNQISVLKSRLGRIQNEKAIINTTINRLHDNLRDTISETEIDLGKIKEFFPTAEIKKIDEINQFHIKLSAILQDEIERRLCVEENDLARVSSIENEIIDRIKMVALADNPANLALDRLVGTKQTIDSLIQGKASYELIQQLAKDYKDAKEMYDRLLESILSRIMFDINKEMENLNTTILGPEKKSPLISLAPSRYSIKSEDDTGTGTSYRVLITFDLALLRLTALPVLIHDSLLFKNIDDDALDGILSLYEENNDKQVFISIDKVGSYGQKVQSIVEEHKVLQLSEGNPFYGKTWKE